jgi:hypothetical protein
MILGVHGIIASSGGVSFDADYQAVLDYATTQGYTLPSASQQTLQNQLVLDLKSGGIWSKLDTFAVFATDGNSDFALIDWIRLSQYTAVNSPTFTSNDGFTGDGISAYIDTNFNLLNDSLNYTQDSASRFGWINGTATLDKAFDGVSSFSNYNSSNIRTSSTGQWRINTNVNADVNASCAGTDYLLHFYRDGASSSGFYSDLSLTSGNTTSSSSLEDATQTIIAGKSSWNFSSLTISIYGMGDDLSNENTDLYNALNTYITSI